LHCQLFLRIKDASKGVPVPGLERLFKLFQLLMEFVHLSSIGDFCILPPALNFCLEVWMF